MTASIRAIHGLDGSRRPKDDQTDGVEVVVIPPHEHPAVDHTHPAPDHAHEVVVAEQPVWIQPKHRRPSRFQLWWRPEAETVSAAAATSEPDLALPQATRDITRSLLELNEERFQALALRLDRVNDELAGIAKALGSLEGYLREDRAEEIDRARWLLGDKLSALLEDLATAAEL